MKRFICLLFLSLFVHLAYSNNICPINESYFNDFFECSTDYWNQVTDEAVVFNEGIHKDIKDKIKICEESSLLNYGFERLLYSAESYVLREFHDSISEYYEFEGDGNWIDEEWSDGTWSDLDWDSENLNPVLEECYKKRSDILEGIYKIVWFVRA